MTDSQDNAQFDDEGDLDVLGGMALTLIRSPDEKVVDFNRSRLAEACQEADVTAINLEVVDGQPVVTLLCQPQAATQEEVEAGLAEAEGDPMIGGPRLCCAVCPVHADNAATAEQSELMLKRLHDHGAGSILAVEIKTGTTYKFREVDGQRLYVPVTSSWALQVWELEDEVEDDEGEADGDDEPKAIEPEVLPPEPPTKPKKGKGK